MSRPAGGDWRISDTPEGWQLEIRYRVALGEILPGYIRRNLPYAFMVFAVNLIGVGVFALLSVGSDPVGFIVVAPVVVAISIALTVIAWPFRFGDVGAPSLDYYLRYREANRIEKAHVRHDKLHAVAGMFDLDRLRTSRLEHVDRFGCLANLVFDGDVVHDVRLVGWPGLPQDVANELCSELHSRATHVVGVSL